LLEEEACPGCNGRDVLRRGFVEVERDGGVVWLGAAGKDNSGMRVLLLCLVEDMIGDASGLVSL
jgi:hypothetical protein